MTAPRPPAPGFASPRPGGPAPVGYIGLEYECANGHRFFINPARSDAHASTSHAPYPHAAAVPATKGPVHIKQRVSGAPHAHTHSPAEEVIVTPEGQPLFVPCVLCKTAQLGLSAQLMRVFVVTPPAGTSDAVVVLEPHVTFLPPALDPVRQNVPRTVDPTSPTSTDRPPTAFNLSRLVLPANTFVVLRLPFVYASPAPAADIASPQAKPHPYTIFTNTVTNTQTLNSAHFKHGMSISERSVG
eukprot:TRINITY_DN5539_c0_g1_i1.p1 TRINITY_DN5539_c0_g1~~TRINITY_DN5539_c0_g1_i1.p1  ORF type:complete len:243 (+),score=41.17 TRINITY_DN5539_c0_g1_i1:87-815(+)